MARRYGLLGRMGLVVMASTLTTSLSVQEAMGDETRRPNVVLFLADDQTWTDVGCYGNKDVKTPNIDRLAREGMRFTRAFSATAMCSPTRQQLYTGIFPVRNGAYPNHSKVKPGTKSFVHYFKDLGYRVGLCGKKHIGPPRSFPFQDLGGKDLDFGAIERFINRDKTQPYFLVVASSSPHGPWTKGDPTQYDPSKLTLPPYLVDTPRLREALTKYYAEITDLDREIGQCMKLVNQSGSEDDTIFIYSSEQGAGFPPGKWTCYDVGLHVAFVVRWPKRIDAGSAAHAMIQYVDVLPTLIAAAGGKPVEGLDGRSFLPVLLSKTDRHRDVVYGVHTTRGIISGSACYPIRSIRTETHKYIWNLNSKVAFENAVTSGRDPEGYWASWVAKAKTDKTAARRVRAYQHRPAEEFYDLKTDPFELKNLAGDPKYRQQIDALRARLKAWMVQQGDEGIETEMKVKQHRSRRATQDRARRR